MSGIVMEKKIKAVAGASLVSLLLLFFFSLVFQDFSFFFGTIILAPLVAGRLILKNKDASTVFSRAFWFMIFNLIFIVVLLFTVGKAAFPDVIFPIAYYYFSLSPFFFSIGGLIRRDAYFFLLLISAVSIAILMYFVPYTRIILILLNLFHFYNAFLVINQFFRKQR